MNQNYSDFTGVIKGTITAQQFTKIVDWNRKRNDLSYSKSLELSMLREEMQEYWAATDVVDKLDAVADILFVGAGTMAKVANYEARGGVIEDFPFSEETFDALMFDLVGALHNEGIAVKFFIDLIQETLDIVIEANSAKLAEKDKNGKVKKPEGFVGPESKIKKLVKKYQKLSKEWEEEKQKNTSGGFDPLTAW